MRDTTVWHSGKKCKNLTHIEKRNRKNLVKDTIISDLNKLSVERVSNGKNC